MLGRFQFLPLGVDDLTPPPPPPPPAHGHLQVNVDRHGEVWVDGRLAGEASPGQPLNLPNQTLGVHQIEVRASDGASASDTPAVVADAWTQANLSLGLPVPPLEPMRGDGLQPFRVKQTDDGFVAIRTDPTIDSQEIGRLQGGMQVECGPRISGRNSGPAKNWRHCPTLGGYVYAPLLNPAGFGAQTQHYRVRATGDGFVAVRSEPSTSSGHRVTKLSTGDRVTCGRSINGEALGEGREWLDCPSVGGWIYAPLLTGE